MKTMRTIACLSLVVVVLGAFGAAHAQSAKRVRAMEVLKDAFEKAMTGKRDEATKLVEQSLSIDPDYAQANLVRAEFAVDVSDWETARRHYERGLSLIDKPNQPLAPREGVEVDIDEVKGTSKCMLGMVYIMLSKKAYADGDDMKEYEFLVRAKRQITEGLKLEPNPHVRAIAEDLLRRYNLDKL